MTGKYTNYNTF